MSSKALSEDLEDIDVLCTFKIKFTKTLTIYKSRSRCQPPVSNLQGPLKPQNEDLKDLDNRVCILKMGLSEVKVSLEVISTTANSY